jgi:predicted dehydrogenase
LYASGLADAVIFGDTTELHVPLVRDALAAGLHVYCEKPFVADAADGYALGEQARAAGLAVQIGFQYPVPTVVRARPFADRRRNRPARFFRSALVARTGSARRTISRRPGWRKEWRHAGGGVLMSPGDPSARRACCGSRTLPHRVTARASRPRHDIEVEDDVMASLEFPNGGRGTIVASLVDPVGSDRIENPRRKCRLMRKPPTAHRHLAAPRRS